jgi:DNA-binding LacI/PurR family transcriptional regulator
MMNVVRGMEDAFSSYGISMVQGTINSNRQLPPIVARGEVDGVIIWPELGEVNPETLEVLRNYQRVYLMTGREKYLPGDRVLNNNERIGILAAKYLIRKGCDKLLQLDFSDPHRTRSAWIERWYGFEEYDPAVEARRLVLGLRSQDTVEMKFPDDERITDELRKAIFENGYNGIFFVCDSLAAMCYPLLRRLGIKIGTDIQVVSCNNERSILAGLDPMPASIDLRPEEIGRKAVEQLRWRLVHPQDKSKVMVEIEPVLNV